MVYKWVQGWTSHYNTLKNINLVKHFNTSLFPDYYVTDEHPCIKEEYVAIYGFKHHEVLFSKKWMNHKDLWFNHTYFHELIHSRSYYTGSFQYMEMIADQKQVAGLEERIADIGAVILCSHFEPAIKLHILKIIYASIMINETNLALPWGEVEEAVLFYVKNKDCPKLKEKIQYVKQIIIDADLCPIHEGKFNGQLQEAITATA